MWVVVQCVDLPAVFIAAGRQYDRDGLAAYGIELYREPAGETVVPADHHVLCAWSNMPEEGES
ncbi:hypothetical protein Slala05_28000 [Streptomyces lavendulae subsp. lavendulae]|nr:hypothetical protein Slala05_28000 [Streptomyces lavendulae subsp. lavendulae]